VNDEVLGIILHGFALFCVAFIIWGGFRESTRAEHDYEARTAGGAR